VDLVITGEGRFDATSLTGKTPGTVIAAAAAAGVPVALVAGQLSGATPRSAGSGPATPRSAGSGPTSPPSAGSDPATPRSASPDPAAPRSASPDPAAPPSVTRVVTLADLAGGPAPALASPARWLREAGRQLARETPG
jgi:hypothetical protein